MEALLVGLLAGFAGVVFAIAGFGLLVTSLPLGGLAETARLDWTVFWAGMLAALVASVLIAIVPGIALGRRGRMQATMAAGRTSGIRGRGGRLEGTLVVAQVALAVLLAAGAGLLIRSVANLRDIDPGVDTEGVVIIDATMLATLPQQGRRQALESVLGELRALPAVRMSAAAQKVPLRGAGDNWGFSIRGRTDVTGVTTAFRMVTRDYFATMGMPIVHGSGFQPSDRLGSAPVVVINEAMAARFFPAEDPVGRIISTGFGDAGERIVGVVANAAEASLTDPPVPARYMLFEHVPFMYHQLSFVLRTDGERQTAAVIRSARSTIARSGSPFAVQETTTMQALFDRAVGPAGQLVWLVSLLAALALLLGAVGVYGVISHYVARRSRDYGIQIALGQEPSRIVRQVVGRGARLVALGGALGVGGAVLLTRTLAALLHGVAPTDPVSLAAAVAALLLVGVLAAALPARRASLTDPVIVLKES
jgi:predicted permease